MDTSPRPLYLKEKKLRNYCGRSDGDVFVNSFDIHCSGMGFFNCTAPFARRAAEQI